MAGFTPQFAQKVDRYLRASRISPVITDFGSVDRTGTVAADQFFTAARDHAIDIGAREVLVPAGVYRLTEARTLEVPGSSLEGFTWRGAGMHVTIIEYEDTDWLVYNDSDALYVNYLGFTFHGDSVAETSKFGYFKNAGQSVRFHNCRWRYWDNIATYEGTSNASEMLFSNCKVREGYGDQFVYDNDQSIVHTFVATDIELLKSGNIWHFKQGGHLNVFGGSIIQGTGSSSQSDAVLRINDSSGVKIGANTWTYNFHGIKTELRDDSLFLKAGVGQAGKIFLNGCNTNVISGSTPTRTVYEIGDRMQFTASGGQINGKFHLQADNASSYDDTHRPATVTLRDCGLGDYFDYTIDSVNNKGGQGVFKIRDCKKSTASGTQEPMDRTEGWQNGATGAAARSFVVAVRAPDDAKGLPVASEELEIKLPLGAVVTGVRLYHTAETGPASQTYTLKNDDGTTTIETWTFNINSLVTAQTDKYYQCDSDNNRTLQFAGDAGNNSTHYNGYCEIEYVA